MKALGGFALASALVLALWAGWPESGAPHPEGTRIWLIYQGVHSGLIVPRSALLEAGFPEGEDFAWAEYLEIGWGDHDYYPRREHDLAVTLSALFWPTPAVLQVVGLRGAPESWFPGQKLVAYHPSPEGLAALAKALSSWFDRGTTGRAPRLGPSLYGRGGFYPARGTFHVFYNCHHWTAELLTLQSSP